MDKIARDKEEALDRPLVAQGHLVEPVAAPTVLTNAVQIPQAHIHVQPTAVQVIHVDQNAVIDGRWRDGVCDCTSETTSCLLSWCCPCFSYANTVSQIKAIMPCAKSSWKANLMLFVFLGAMFQLCSSAANNIAMGGQHDQKHHKHHKHHDDDDTAERMSTPEYHIASFLTCLAGVFLLALVSGLRTRFRQKFSLPGSRCADCCCSMFCGVLVLAQMDRHIGTSRRKGGCVLNDPGELQLQQPSHVLPSMQAPAMAVAAPYSAGGVVQPAVAHVV
jgi:Cys-rich protein (TIGR01571 family)